MTKNRKIEKIYNYNIKTIWKALTDNKILNQWLMENNFEANIEHQFTFTYKPRFGWDGKVYCKVLEVKEPNILSYTWKGSNKKGEIETIVKFTLEEKNNNTTLLKLEHTGFRGINGLFVGTLLNAGWKKLLSSNLENILKEVK